MKIITHANKECLTKLGVMYFLSIKRYNLEYTKFEKLGNGISHYKIAIFFVLGIGSASAQSGD